MALNYQTSYKLFQNNTNQHGCPRLSCKVVVNTSSYFSYNFFGLNVLSYLSSLNYNGDICIKRQKIMFQISYMQYEINVNVDMGMTHHYLNDLTHMRKIDFLGVACL